MPSAVDIFDSRALSRLSSNANGERGLLLKVGGNAKAVDRQIRDTRSICSEAANIEVLSGEEQELVWNNAREMQSAAAAAGAAVCKISILSSEVPQVFDEVRAVGGFGRSGSNGLGKGRERNLPRRDLRGRLRPGGCQVGDRAGARSTRRRFEVGRHRILPARRQATAWMFGAIRSIRSRSAS